MSSTTRLFVSVQVRVTPSSGSECRIRPVRRTCTATSPSASSSRSWSAGTWCSSISSARRLARVRWAPVWIRWPTGPSARPSRTPSDFWVSVFLLFFPPNKYRRRIVRTISNIMTTTLDRLFRARRAPRWVLTFNPNRVESLKSCIAYDCRNVCWFAPAERLVRDVLAYDSRVFSRALYTLIIVVVCYLQLQVLFVNPYGNEDRTNVYLILEIIFENIFRELRKNKQSREC